MIDALKGFVREMVTARERLESGASNNEEVQSPLGAPLRMKRRDNGTIETSYLHGTGPRSTTFPADLLSAPRGYPADLPFIRGVASHLIEVDDPPRRMLSWSGSPDMKALLARVAEELSRAGWAPRGPSVRPGHVFGRAMEYRKGAQSSRLTWDRFPGPRRRVRLVVVGHAEGADEIA